MGGKLLTQIAGFLNKHRRRNTQEQITLAEAKLRQLSSDKPSNRAATSPLSHHSSLPPKPPSALPIRPNSGSSTPYITPSTSKSSLPSLPLPPQPKTSVVNSVVSSSAPPSSSALSAPFPKKTPKLSGVRLIRKSKDGTSIAGQGV